MEAVPRLRMLSFPSKESPKPTTFDNLKSYITNFYQEDSDKYVKLLNAARASLEMNKSEDYIKKLKTYYFHLQSMRNHFPQLLEKNRTSPFKFFWKGLYDNKVYEHTNLYYEQAAILFNIATAHTQEGAAVMRTEVDGMKLACTHYQCAAWALGELRNEQYSNLDESGTDILTPELLLFMQQVAFAQAQECILEKSLIDNRKSNIVAKVTAQIITYYNAALAALLTGEDKSPIAALVDRSVYKLWKKYVRFKISYLGCILYLYQGQQAEEQNLVGERCALYEAASNKLEEARKESKGLPDEKDIQEALTFTMDVVEGKRKNAIKENEFIYHVNIPELNTIAAVKGANLVNGIKFSITDPDLNYQDIFAHLVPMKAHEASSLYSEEKAKLLRKYGAKIEEKDNELLSFMNSLSLDNLNINEEKANKLPQNIVDRCASLNANKTAIPDLMSAMTRLLDLSAEVEANLKDIGAILAQEDKEEREFQQMSGVQRPPNAHVTELMREYQKYSEAHQKANESNETLRKAVELHINNLKILAKPLPEVQQSVPKLSSELNTTEIFKDVKLIVNKVNEMKAQRSQFHADLRIAINDDDITAKVIAHGSNEGLQYLFQRELEKHERITQLIDQNLLAQENILKALTENYAKAAPVLKTLADVKHKRENFFTALAASFDVYEDLLAKSSKGLEFYVKLSGNVQKLLSRCKSAKDVQTEERQQRLIRANNKLNITNSSTSDGSLYNTTTNSSMSSAPKLRDYLKSKNVIKDAPINNNYVPLVRPNPLGSENPTQATCSTFQYTNNLPSTIATTSVGPNEPPPPYSLQQASFGITGYTNPIYAQYQQNVAPPAYKLQASPNSQLAAHMAATTNVLQQQQLQSQEQNVQLPYQQHGIYSNSEYNTMAPLPTSQVYDPNIIRLSQMNPSATVTTTSTLLSAPNSVNNNPKLTNQITNIPQLLYNQSSIEKHQGISMQSEIRPQPSINNVSNQIHSGSNSVMYGPTGSTYLPQHLNTVSNYAAQPNIAIMPIPQTPGTTNIRQPQQQQQQQMSLTQDQCQQRFSQSNQTTSGFVNLTNKSIQQMQSALSDSVHNLQESIPPAAPVPISLNAVSANFIQEFQQPQPQAQLSITSQQPHSSAPSTVVSHQEQMTSQTKLNETLYSLGQLPNMNTIPPHSNNELLTSHAVRAAYPYTSHIGTPNKYQQVISGDSKVMNKTNENAPIISHTKKCIPTQLPSIANANINKNDNCSYNSASGEQNNTAVNFLSSTVTINEAINQTNVQNINNGGQSATLHVTHPPSVQTTVVNFVENNSGSNITNGQLIRSTTGTTAATTPAIIHKTTTHSNAELQQPTVEKITSINNSKIDLLSDIDSGIIGPTPMLPEPVLKPVVLASPATSQVQTKSSEHIQMPSSYENNKQKQVEEYIETQIMPETKRIHTNQQLPMSPIDSQHERKSSLDNISICSDLSSLENFDWDSVSMRSDKLNKYSNTNSNTVTNNNNNNNTSNNNNNDSFLMIPPQNPFNDDKILKYFHKEVERYERIIETLNVKMLNGNTPLTSKWKELHDMLSKGAETRNTIVARLFPEKNRSLDCLPYDHARVKLDKETDDYINAAYIQDLSYGCPNVIIAQTPQQNTINDFWSMLWSEKARTVVCLHPPNEILDPFWPQILDQESHFDDYSVKCVRIIKLSHSQEYQLKLSMLHSDAIIELSIIQIKAWSKSNNMQVLSIANNILGVHRQRCLNFNTPNSPLVLSCLTGSERSGLLVVALCIILATESKRPTLINVVDVWQRICSRRQQGLRDIDTLERSFQMVLNHAHDVLNKRGIMTSYQMKIIPQQKTMQEEQIIKDPLNELDALWKLKMN